MTSNEFYTFVYDVAKNTFGSGIFPRRKLMIAVEDQLKKQGKWPTVYDEISGSSGKKSKGLARIDYAFLPLRKDGRFVRHDRDQWSVEEGFPDLDQECLEGGRVTRTHLIIERNLDAIRKKKADVLKTNGGRLACEVCGFDFKNTYGSLGAGFIECHHLIPLFSLNGKRASTSNDDLIVVCSNCHRMVHRNLNANPSACSLNEIKKFLAPRG